MKGGALVISPASGTRMSPFVPSRPRPGLGGSAGRAWEGRTICKRLRRILLRSRCGGRENGCAADGMVEPVDPDIVETGLALVEADFADVSAAPIDTPSEMEMNTGLAAATACDSEPFAIGPLAVAGGHNSSWFSWRMIPLSWPLGLRDGRPISRPSQKL